MLLMRYSASPRPAIRFWRIHGGPSGEALKWGYLKKSYEKPVLAKREKLSDITARPPFVAGWVGETRERPGSLVCLGIKGRRA